MKAIGVGIFILVFSFGALSSKLNAQELSWQEIETKYFKVYYKSSADLNKFLVRISRDKSCWICKRGLEKKDKLPRVEELDELFEKTMKLLGMYPKDAFVSIWIYPDLSSLQEDFERFSRSYKNVWAFYSPRRKLIAVSCTNVDRGIVAHEMAHAVLDFSIEGNPTPEVQELLATYVMNKF